MSAPRPSPGPTFANVPRRWAAAFGPRVSGAAFRLRENKDQRVLADDQTSLEIKALVDATYEAMSTPGSSVADFFSADEIAVAGSGQGELWSGPDEVIGVATVISSWGLRWTADKVTVWRRDELAWGQILGSVRVVRDGVDEVVPYWTTGVFEREKRPVALALLGRL